MYRVDGVSGLNVFTGIKNPYQVTAWSSQTINPVPQWRDQLSACRFNAVLSGSPERSAEYSNEVSGRNRFLPTLEDFFRRGRSAPKPVNQSYLRGKESEESKPCQDFAEAQGSLGAAREPETQPGRPKLDQIPIAENTRLNGVAVDYSQGAGLNSKGKSDVALEVDLQVPIPNS